VVFCAQEPTSGIIYVYDEYFHSNKLYEESAMDVEKMIGDIKFEYFACDLRNLAQFKYGNKRIACTCSSK